MVRHRNPALPPSSHTDGSYGYYSVTAQVSNSITGVEDLEIPKEYSLSQNYPNPFNPTTTIQYTIPLLGGDERGGLVTLKIYDILGNEVTTLVNEQKAPGNYSVKFDSSDLSSGVYIYALKTGMYSSIKKMTLLK